MKRSNVRNLYLVAVAMAILGGIGAGAGQYIYGSDAMYAGLEPPEYSLLYIAVVVLLFTADALTYEVFARVLVILAQFRRWDWFVAMAVAGLLAPLSPILALPIYFIAGPRGERVESSKDLVVSGANSESSWWSGAFGEPKSLSTPVQRTQYASWVERTFAATIDFFLLSARLITLGCIVNGGALLIGDLVLNAYPTPSYSLSALDIFWPVALLVALSSFFMCGLYLVFIRWPREWAKTGQTQGLRTLNIRLVQENGERLPFLMGIVRAIAMLTVDIVVVGIPIGWLWMIVDPKTQTWHDKIAGTIVVRVSSSE